MGHDIIAGNLSDQQIYRIYDQISGIRPWTPEEWQQRFDGLGQSAWAGHLRRSAYDEYNKVIYRALSAEDLYPSCSGSGGDRWYTRQEIKAAMDLLPSIVADKAPPIDTRVVDALSEEIPMASAQEAQQWTGIEWEREFLQDILDWLDKEQRDTVRIYYG